MHPGRRALIDLQGADLAHDLRHELRRARTGTDDGDPPARQIVVVVPPRRMEGGASEGVDPGDVGDIRDVQGPDARHYELADVLAAGSGEDVPLGQFVVPVRPGDRGVEVDVPAQVVLRRDISQIGQDLGPAREEFPPVGSGFEREGVQVSGHVTGASGIGVVPPGPPTSSAFSRMTKSSLRAFLSAIPIPSPEKPVPMMTTRVRVTDEAARASVAGISLLIARPASYRPTRPGCRPEHRA